MEIKFARFGSDWAVRVWDDAAGAIEAGTKVTVTKRNGDTTEVTLGECLESKYRGKARVYAIAPEFIADEPAQADQPAWPDVPAGRYALVTSDKLEFFKVDRPQRGRWAGYTFLARMHGENHEPIKEAGLKREVLERIAANHEEALRAYGRHFNVCGCCMKDLTDKFSRFFGVGPVCRRRHGMPISEADFIKRGGVLPVEYVEEERLAMKAEFAAREREQENAAFEAKMRRDEALFGKAPSALFAETTPSVA